MIHAVLGGHCSDIHAVATTMPSDLLTVLAPRHMLSKASGGPRAYTLAAGHLDTPVSARQRQAAMRRLIARDSRFERIQRMLRFGRGQSGTASPWANTARALKTIYGPCWLAAEIAVIGASIPNDAFRTSGDIDQGADPFGPAPDYGLLLRDVRLNRRRSDWWSSKFANHTDSLSRATWALALVSTAAEDTVVANLPHVDAVVGELPTPMVRALVASSSRIAASGLARRLGYEAAHAAVDMRPATALLVAHHTASDHVAALSAYSTELLGEFSTFGASGWPGLSVLTRRMRQNSSSELLGHVRRFGPKAQQPSFDLRPEAIEQARSILSEAAAFPLEWVLAAEQLVSSSATDRPLIEIADAEGWFGT